MPITPLIAIHMGAALAATAIGPVALWSRRQGAAHPRLHRAAGYAFVTLMVCAALSACFIRSHDLPNWGGYTPIHLLIPVALLSMGRSLWQLYRGNIAAHRKIMRGVYIGACIVAGLFTLMPGRYLGGLLWRQLGLL